MIAATEKLSKSGPWGGSFLYPNFVCHTIYKTVYTRTIYVHIIYKIYILSNFCFNFFFQSASKLMISQIVKMISQIIKIIGFNTNTEVK